jgi:hypothetical protein
MRVNAGTPWHDRGRSSRHQNSSPRYCPATAAIILDGGDIKRLMFVDWKDERLQLWKPGHNITYCRDENK